MWYSENCHVTALKVNTRVLPMDLDTRVPVISQPASPHHDIDAWGLRFAPRWRSLRWQSSICSSWRKKVWGHHRGNSYLAIFASVVTSPARGRDGVLVLNLRWNYSHCCAKVLKTIIHRSTHRSACPVELPVVCVAFPLKKVWELNVSFNLLNIILIESGFSTAG